MSSQRCNNCGNKIKSHSSFGNTNRALTSSSLKLLNDFLPDDLVKESFCYDCTTTIEIRTSLSIYDKLNEWLKPLEKKKLDIMSSFDSIQESILKKKIIVFDSYKDDIKLYSIIPDKIKTLEFIDNSIIVDSGMWSTSSDNLDAMWSAVHDSIARKGLDSDNKLNKGLFDSKESLKRMVFLNGGNCVVDLKHSFSELAGNGKILIYSQGTMGIDSTKKLVNFNDVEKEFKDELESLESQLNEIHITQQKYHLERLNSILTTLEYAESDN